MRSDGADAGLRPSGRRPRIPGGGPQTVADVLARPVAERPRAEALVGRHRRYTYAELDAAVDRAAGALIDLGTSPGTRVAACLGNHPDIVIAFLGAMRIGAVWVGINVALAPPEKAYMMEDTGTSILLTYTAMLEGMHSSVGLPASLDEVVTVDETGAGEWSALLTEAEPDRPDIDVDPFAPAAIAFTGGTTGFPKGAVHSQHNLLLPGTMQRAAGMVEPGSRQGVCLPLTILNLMIMHPLVSFQNDAVCVTMDRTDAVGMAELIRDERINSFSSVPAQLHDLLTHDEIPDEWLRSLTRPGVGGAELPGAFRRLYEERFGGILLNGYGMTEAPSAVALTDTTKTVEGGETFVALPHVEISVRDGHDAVLPTGEEGEVCVGPATTGQWKGVYTPMLGYWGRPDDTERTLAGGVLHTGDVGVMNDDGGLHLSGRRGEMIIRGGANVYPAEVERVLHDHPAVAACAVLGRPDERLGECVVAFVEPEPGATDDADFGIAAKLTTHCHRNLARYKVPDDFILVESFERTPMGKIRLEPLRALL